MKISTYPPPVYERAKELWGVDFNAGVVFTYSDTVHVASGTLTSDLAEHESTHIRQQTTYPGGPDAWWEEYFTNPKFRLEQEAEAYKAQLKHLVDVKGIRGKNQIFNLTRILAHQLSGSMYGGCTDVLTAINLIKNG